MYVAIINVPGYLPDTDTPAPQFDTAREAWNYLSEEMQASYEEYAWTDDGSIAPALAGIQRHELAIAPDGASASRVGTVYTPDGAYAFSVDYANEDEEN